MRKYSVLDTFLIVSKERSVTKAAKILGISQAAVSKQMKALEEYLGCVLFEESKIPKQLNSDGKAFEKITRTYISSLEQLRKDQLLSANSLKGYLTLSCPNSCENLVLRNIITNFGCLYPNVSIRISNKDTIRTMDIHSSGLFILVSDKEKIPGSILITELAPLPLGVAIPKGIPLSHNTIIRERDIHNLRLIMSSNLSINPILNSWLGDKAPSMICDDWELTQNIMESGGGVSIVPLELKKRATTFFTVIPMLPLVSVKLKLVYKSLSEMSPVEKAFARYTRKVASENYKF